MMAVSIRNAGSVDAWSVPEVNTAPVSYTHLAAEVRIFGCDRPWLDPLGFDAHLLHILTNGTFGDNFS